MDMSTPAGGSSGKAVMLTANQSIANLSEFSIQSCYNGNSTPGSSSNPYFAGMSALPAISISAGQHLLLCRDSTGLSNYFDGDLEQFPGAMHPTLFYESGFPSANGNDAFILKNSGSDVASNTDHLVYYKQ